MVPGPAGRVRARGETYEVEEIYASVLRLVFSEVSNQQKRRKTRSRARLRLRFAFAFAFALARRGRGDGRSEAYARVRPEGGAARRENRERERGGKGHREQSVAERKEEGTRCGKVDGDGRMRWASRTGELEAVLRGWGRVPLLLSMGNTEASERASQRNVPAASSSCTGVGRAAENPRVAEAGENEERSRAEGRRNEERRKGA